MTPFELALENELSVESLRFANDWLFRWHNISSHDPRRIVDVDRFDGGRIRVGGIRFEGQQQAIFWGAVSRYLDQKAHEVFKHWDTETRSYPEKIRRASIDGVENRLLQFAAGIIKRSAETDRALRGGGYPQKVEPFDSSRAQTRANTEIRRLADSHRSLLNTTERSTTEMARSELISLKPGIHGISIDLKEAWRRLVGRFK